LGFVIGRGAAGKEGEPAAAEAPVQTGQVEGTVLVRHSGCEVWRVLKPGAKIYIGDTFCTAAKGCLKLEFGGESQVEMKENSTLVLRSCNGGTELYLECGQLAADLEGGHPRFVVSTPHGRAEALGTKFTVRVE
jgi:ferric-dicitrate binding protein FerR (iron transport regulator)